MKTLVVGLGNPYLTDDGVGVRVAYELEKRLGNWRLSSDGEDLDNPNPHSSIHVAEASVGGLRLMELMIGYDRVIIADAYTKPGERQPGRIHRMTLDDLRAVSPTQHSASAHDATLVTALDSGRALGFHLPDEVIIFAVEVENVLDFSEEPTTAVAAAIPEMVTVILQELKVELSGG
jgi:hydrogenase maturation protease